MEIAMHKKLTITVEEEIYDALLRVVGRGKISRFIEDLVRPLVIGRQLDLAYSDMAADEEREADALEWAEATMGDVADESR
jgi:predicted CopG family antitoxin